MIDERCKDRFTNNLFGFEKLLSEEDFEANKKEHGKKASDFVSFTNDAIAQKRLENCKLYFVKFSEIDEEEFDRIQNEKENFFFVGIRREKKDSNGITKIYWE